MAIVFKIPSKFPILRFVCEGITVVLVAVCFIFLVYAMIMAKNLITFIFLLFFVMIWGFFSWVFYKAFLGSIRDTRRLFSFYKIVFLDGNKIKFGENIKFEIGTFKIESCFVRRYDSSSKTYKTIYVTNVDFKPEGIMEGNRLNLEKFRNKNYKICIGSGGEGLCIIPGLKIYSEKWENICILIIPVCDAASEKHIETSLTYKNNSAKLLATLKRDGLLEGKVYWKKGDRVRSVKIEVECGDGKEVIARSKERYFDFYKNFLVKDYIVIITLEEYIDCKKISDIFGRDSVVLGKGVFKIKIVFDIPLAFDKVKEIYVKV